ncbi:putative MFS-type transporter YhjX [Pigmentiphaga humi]|uniref:Putative MFS-type transporter YhjX n=1 Tax=Pigmentiphaga humi TaxID=2478468 RepID=A0A3P4AYX2_9BURK|nr:MFS transporter [Pigmentiphaga humi]VCU69233.1 putative MFS-type transporter YhjX [Pigmentiphaga humi]
MSAQPASHPISPASPATVVACASVVLLCVMGVRATFGLFMQPMGLAHGWGRDVFSLAFAIQNLVWGLAAILMGSVADKWGSGRTVVASALLFVLGLLGTRYADSEAMLYLSAGVLVGLGQAGTTFAVLLPVVARAVPVERRSVAMGVASAGGSMGQFVVVPAGQWLIDTLDWTGALWVLAALMLLALPLATRLTGKPRHVAGSQSLGAAVRQAVGHSTYHFLFWSYAVCGFHTAFITLHLPAFVVDGGLKASDGAMAIALIGLFNVFGSYWAGKMGGHHSKKHLLALLYATRSAAILLLLFLPLQPAVLYAFSALMGLVWLGTVPLTTGLVGHIYGMRYASTLTGIVFFGHQIGSFVGVWLGGKLYVATGSYDVVWWMSVALGLAAAALCLPVRERALAPA